MNPLRAILLKLASVAVLVAMESLIKAAAETVPPGETVFFRSAFAMPVILVWLAARGELGTGLRVHDVRGHVLRALVGVTAMGFLFTGLGLLPLSEVKALSYATPLFVVIFAALLLGERVRLVRLAAVALGLVGVLIVLSPRLAVLSEGAAPREAVGGIVVLVGATLAALSQVIVRKLIRTEQTSAIVFWFSASASILSLATLPFGWVVPDAPTAAMLVAAGLLGGLGQLLLTAAFRNADAGVVAPFDYASILLAVAIGYAVFGELPTRETLLGAALVIAAGGVIIWRERRLGVERARARRAMTPQG